MDAEVSGAIEIELDGTAVRVAPGRYAVAGGEVEVRQGGRFFVPSLPVAHVEDEPLRLSPRAPAGFGVGTRLAGPDAQDINALGALVPGSLCVRTRPGGDVLEVGRDYLVAETHAMVGLGPESRVTSDDVVYASYDYALMRLDVVYVDGAGNAGYKVGISHITTPLPPAVGAGCVRLAHVFRPYHATRVAPDHVYPILAAPDEAATATTPGRIPRTLAKLRRGEPVTIVCWGDSVTAGGNASAPRRRYPDVFLRGLRERFPGAEITLHNVSVGGSNSLHWLHPETHPFHHAAWQPQLDFDRVLAPRPDLVTMEFVNDVGLDAAARAAAYEEVLARLAAAGAEWILLTPHFTHPDWMGFDTMRGAENRPYVAFLKAFAAAHHLALADASARWAHLWREGIPYLILLHNSVNHPDDRGHRLFAEELWYCFES